MEIWFTGFFSGNHPYFMVKKKNRITPDVNNFSRLGLSIEKQQGKRKYESDGGVMVGEFVCVCVYVHVQVCHFGSVLTICVPSVRGSL